jgi:hypothetical protein
MKSSGRCLAAGLALFAGLAAPAAHAVAPRAYVSVNGNDANVCSDPATPCRTFVGAIAQVTTGGEVVVLESGTYGGGTISKSVTISAPPGVVAVVAATLSVLGADALVTLRGISSFSPTSTPSGDGVVFYAGVGINLENCVFRGWSYGVWFKAPGKLNVTDTTFRDNVFGANLNTNGTAGMEASFERTRWLNNTYGLTVIGHATITDSVFSGNQTGLGAYNEPAFSTSSDVSLESSIIASNSQGGLVSTSGAPGQGSATLRVSNTSVTNNGTGLLQQNLGVLQSRGGNTIEGNGTDIVGTLGSYSGK